MTKVCDHTSVGMLVWREDKLLLIERARFPFGFSIPAGHVDGDATFEEAARRELKEEVGLEAEELKLIKEGRKENTCRRGDGTWHHWKLYQVTASGEVQPSKDEAKRAGWYTKTQVKELSQRNEQFLSQEISEEEWLRNPGLEPVMYEWFKELEII